MSKTYDENVRKARAIADGIGRNLSKLKSYGISQSTIDALIEAANDTATKGTEVDELRKLVNEKASSARAALLNLTDRVRDVKQIIKRNFEQSKWLDFGIEDKR